MNGPWVRNPCGANTEWVMKLHLGWQLVWRRLSPLVQLLAYCCTRHPQTASALPWWHQAPVISVVIQYGSCSVNKGKGWGGNKMLKPTPPCNSITPRLHTEVHTATTLLRSYLNLHHGLGPWEVPNLSILHEQERNQPAEETDSAPPTQSWAALMHKELKLLTFRLLH